jgi:hypothetical protein
LFCTNFVRFGFVLVLLLAPRKLNQDGDFLSYSLPHFYEHDPSRRRKRPRKFTMASHSTVRTTT